MRLNQFIARATGISRRAADSAITEARVSINGKVAGLGDSVKPDDTVTLNGKRLTPQKTLTVMLNKPAGYVCSRDGQGSKTIYELLPPDLHRLKPIGRLDKDSSGLLLLTNDGNLANELTHPRHQKIKVYEVSLDKDLKSSDKARIGQGVKLEDGISRFRLEGNGKDWTIIMSEGRNRQIRRTFEKIGYQIKKLHRVKFGPYKLGSLTEGDILLTS